MKIAKKKEEQKRKVWMIQNNKGEYSSGSDYPMFHERFSCVVWTNESQVKSHMTRVMKTEPKLYEECDAHIVEFELHEVKRDNIAQMYKKRMVVDRL